MVCMLKFNPVECEISHVYKCSVFICKVDLIVLGIFFNRMSPLCITGFLEVLLPYSQSVVFIVRRLYFLSLLGLPFLRRVGFFVFLPFSAHLLWWLLWQKLGEVKPQRTQEMMSYVLFYICLTAAGYTLTMSFEVRMIFWVKIRSCELS